MIKKTETESLRDQIALLQRQVLAYRGMLQIVTRSRAPLTKAAQAAGDELRELQARERKRSDRTIKRMVVLTGMVAFVAFWFGVAGVELARALAQ